MRAQSNNRGCMGFVNFHCRLWLAVVLLPAVVAFHQPLQAQSSFTARHRTGFSAGFGNQLLMGKPYRYQVYLFNITHHRLLWHTGTGALELLLMAQLNPSRFKKEDWHPDFTSGLEYGLNAGAVYRRPVLGKKHSVYALISSGPHHVNDAPVRQQKGFLFCNFFAAGLTLQHQRQLPADLRLGVRHISNLGIRVPNGGINNLFVAVTVYPF